jgi:hypothetical protein
MLPVFCVINPAPVSVVRPILAANVDPSQKRTVDWHSLTLPVSASNINAASPEK